MNKTTMALSAVAVMTTATNVLADGMLKEWPAVLAKMPADTRLAVMGKSFAEQDHDWGQFVAAVELGAMGVPNPSDMLAGMGPAMQHIDHNAPIGMAMVSGPLDEGKPPMLMFVPVSNYQGLADALSTGVEDGLHMIDFGNGEQWYGKQSGKYAVLGLDQEIVSGYTGNKNAMAKFSRIAGPSAAQIARDSDWALIVDFEGLDEVVNPLLDQAEVAFNEQLEMAQAMGMGGNLEQAEMMMALYREAVEIVMEDGQCLVVGASAGAKGFRIDSNMSWRLDTTLGNMFKGGNDARDLLSRCNNSPYLLAISMDMKGFDIGGFMDTIMARLPEELQNIQSLQSSPAVKAMMEQADGSAMVIYPSPAGVLGGAALSGLATVYTGDAAKLRGSMKSMFTDMNGTEQNGVSFTSEYGENAAEIEGVSVDTYSMQMKFPPEMAQAGQAMGMMYGPGGMRGYIVPTEGGIIMTASRNKVLVRKMLAAQGNDNNGLAGDAGINAVNEMLPGNAAFRAYFSLGTLAQWVGPMAAMVMPGLDLSAMNDLPPIAMAASVEANSVRKTLVVPAPLIRAGINVAMQAQAAQMGMGGGGGGDEEEEPPLF
ncbi:MAG: hypothetical protein D8M59_04580 [Planctomycetes bacterium]|nr:hypothetical protein [Planctomycetota bacterium]